MPISALRLINPPGHTWRRSTFPRYADGVGSSYRSPYVNPHRAPASSYGLGLGASMRAARKLEEKKRKERQRALKVKGNPMIKRRRKKVKANRPLFTSGPKKGQFMSNAAIARRRSAKKAARTNPKPKKRRTVKRRAAPKRNVAPKRRRRTRRNPPPPSVMLDAIKHPRSKKAKAALRKYKRKHGKQFAAASTAVGTAVSKQYKRRKAAKKAAATRKRNKAARSRAAKKAAATRRRGTTTMAKRKTHKRKAKKSGRRPAVGTHAYYVWLGKKGARAAKRSRKAKGTAAPKRRRKTRKARKSVGGRVLTRKSPIKYRYTTKRGKRRKIHLGQVKLKRTKKTAKRRSYLRPFAVRRNPGMSDVKNALITGGVLFGGFLGMRVIANVLQQQLFAPGKPLASATASLPAQLVKMLPSGLAFVASLFLGKVVKNTKIVQAAQTGATLVLLDAVFTNFIKPSLPPSVTAYLGGVSDMGYGRMGEYLPQRQQLPMAGMGLDVHEAMALDEYVPDRGMGMQVEEALAESEVEGMQRGYAAGSLSRTVFSS